MIIYYGCGWCIAELIAGKWIHSYEPGITDSWLVVPGTLDSEPLCNPAQPGDNASKHSRILPVL